MEIDANLVHYKELSVTGTTACSTQDCRAAAIVNAGRLDLAPLVTRRLPLGEAKDRSGIKTVLMPRAA